MKKRPEKDGKADEMTVTFTEAANRENIVTGEKASTLMGKIKKWLADLAAAAFMQVVTSYSDLMAGTALDDYLIGAAAAKEGFTELNRKLEAKIGYMDSQSGTKIINNNGSYIIQSNGYIRTYFDTSPGAVRVNNVTYIYFGSSIIMTFPPIPVKAGDIITAVGFNSNQSSISFVPEASSE